MFVFSSLIHNPSLVVDSRYPLIPDDFPERFHRIVFGAIDHLVRSGLKTLDEAIIDKYIEGFPTQYSVFTQNDGMSYIRTVVEGFYAPDNFDSNYLTVRKCSLLNHLASFGYPITTFFDPSEVDPDKIAKIQERFNTATLDEIINQVSGGITEVQSIFSSGVLRKSIQAGKGMLALKESLKQTPEMGMPLNSPKLTTILRGRRLGKLYLRIMPTGMGKTRVSYGDAAYISIPELWDVTQKCWVKTGCSEPTVLISTELQTDEVQTLLMAYIAAVPEDHILNGKYDAEEEARVDYAIQIIEKAPIYIEHMPDFNIDDVERVIQEYKAKYNIGYVFFDYLQTSMKLMQEVSSKTKVSNLREDNVLTLFSARLKLLSQRLNLHIDTSVQANGDWKNMKDPDQNITRGSKAISDKVDAGYCGLPPTEKDMEAFKRICTDTRATFLKEPNLVLHIYKVRRGSINHVKLFQHFDYGTLRTTDLFVTDKNYKLLDVEGTQVELILEQTREEPEQEDPPFII